MRKNRNVERNKIDEKKWRSGSKCPENLCNLIFWTNYITSDASLPEIAIGSDLWKSARHELQPMIPFSTGNDGELSMAPPPTNEDIQRVVVWKLAKEQKAKKNVGLFIELWRDTLKYTQQDLTDIRFMSLYQPDVVQDFIERYDAHRHEIIKLREIARMLNDIRKGIKQSDEIKVFNETSYLRIDNEKAEIDISSYYFIFNAIKGIHPHRLRICEICDKVFWAVNRKSETCSKPCLNALRQRRHRKKNKDKVNANRRKNYELKKKGIVK